VRNAKKLEKLSLVKKDEIRKWLSIAHSQCMQNFRINFKTLSEIEISEQQMNQASTDVINRALKEFEASILKYGMKDCEPYIKSAQSVSI
jgi:predicted type IV restriction endonuclease